MPDVPTLQQLVHALGWMLVHFLWQGGLIAAMLWLVFRLARPESANLRYWSGLTAYLACALVPLATLVYYLDPAPGALPAPEMSLPAVSVVTGYRVSAWQSIQLGLEPALPLIVVAWAIGVLALSSRTFMGWLGTRRLVRSGVAPVNTHLREMANRLRVRLRVRRMVQVLQSTRVAVPTLVGWLKPVILLPASVIAQLPAAQLEMILAHELAHVRRHDYLVNLLQIVIETLFFYHPAVRWMSRQVGQEREHCCDDIVVAQFGHPLVYARALASIEALKAPVMRPALAASGGDLFERVNRIVHPNLPRNNTGFAQVILIAGIALAASLSAHQGIEIARNSGAAERWVTSQPSSEGRIGSMADSRLGAGYRQFGENLRRTELARQAEVRAEARARREQITAERLEILTPVEVTGRHEVFQPVDHPLPASRPETQLASVAQPTLQDTEVIPARYEGPGKHQPTVAPLRVVAPRYPGQAERDGTEGYVKLRFTVSPRGKARNIEVVDASPPELFERAATKALKKWEFEVFDAHDPARPLVQTFDFALLAANAPDEGARQSRRCSLTGSRICPKNVTEEDIQGHYNRNQD